MELLRRSSLIWLSKCRDNRGCALSKSNQNHRNISYFYFRAALGDLAAWGLGQNLGLGSPVGTPTSGSSCFRTDLHSPPRGITGSWRTVRETWRTADEGETAMDKLLKLEKKTYSLTFFYVSLLGVWGHSSVRKATSNNNDLSTDLNAQGDKLLCWLLLGSC